MKKRMSPSQWHDFGPGDPVEDVSIPCLTCGVEVQWSKGDDNRILAVYRRPGGEWSKDRPRCHEQTGLFG